MSVTYPSKVQALVRALLQDRDSSPALRRAVVARAIGVGSGAPAGPDVPAALLPYVEKVARWAYKVADEDVARLRAAGYTEDDIFEVTVSAAVGAGLARLDAGLAAIQGGRQT